MTNEYRILKSKAPKRSPFWTWILEFKNSFVIWNLSFGASRRQAGSILVDLMVGTAILASGLFSVWASLATISSFVTLDRQRSDARLALVNQLEVVRGTSFDQLRLGTTTSSVSSLPSGQVAQTVTAVTDDLRQVALTASWTAQTGPRTATVVTQIARGGIGGN